MTLEICVSNLESALRAQEAGAHRIELCRNLSCGGLTPLHKDIAEAARSIGIPVHVLIRPRPGDFCYSDKEFFNIIKSIQHCKQHQIAGVVVGCLNKDNALNLGQMKEICREAKGMSITFHRAFDLIVNKLETALKLGKLGVDRILTSGGPGDALENLSTLVELKNSSPGLSVLPGGNIRSFNIAKFIEAGFTEIHSSALSGSSEIIDKESEVEITQMLEIMEHYESNL